MALFAALVASLYAIMGFEDFKNPAVSFWLSAVGEVILWSMVLVALDLGIRFLRFALVGKSRRNSTWMRRLLVGIACFFPGFLFSALLAGFWTKYVWPRRYPGDTLLLVFSLCVGAAAAVVGSIAQLRKRTERKTP
jgi:hypothetical protein